MLGANPNLQFNVAHFMCGLLICQAVEGVSGIVKAILACKTWIYYMFVALCLLAQSKHILRMNPGNLFICCIKNNPFYRAYKGGTQMRRKGSSIAEEIMRDLHRAQKGKERAERNKKHEKDKQKEERK